MNSTDIIIGMAITTAVSATVQIILKALGKKDESVLLDFVTKCLMVTTAATAFTGAIKALTTIV